MKHTYLTLVLVLTLVGCKGMPTAHTNLQTEPEVQSAFGTLQISNECKVETSVDFGNGLVLMLEPTEVVLLTLDVGSYRFVSGNANGGEFDWSIRINANQTTYMVPQCCVADAEGVDDCSCGDCL